MRKGFSSLALIVQEVLKCDPHALDVRFADRSADIRTAFSPAKALNLLAAHAGVDILSFQRWL
ncbi:hypothetical protein [Lichenihabitans psoromatis]|uniref:hypothetical protein n=1 Tax=Lichenihabitans psoromatis TaxID=2528642 RepID=UPI001FE22064|nr:hypothetical protein [Lichenihabitans psoromatis]